MIKEINNREALKAAITETKKLVVIKFYASWCNACQEFGPVFKKIAEEFKKDATFLKVNIEKSEDLAKEYNVLSIPTIFCFKNGSSVWVNEGSVTENIFRKEILKIIK